MDGWRERERKRGKNGVNSVLLAMMMIIIAFNFHSPLIEMHGGGGGIRSWG